MAEPTNAPRGARERARAEIMAELLTSARAHLVADGAASLSLRAVARDLGVASSAVYRYVESRDALLTLLIVEAYDAAGAAAEEADRAAEQRGDAPAQRWLKAARAVRAWAIANPHSFELVYGTPVRGYRAPTDTVAPALRLWGVVVRVLLAAHADGSLRPVGPGYDPRGLVEPDVYAFAGLGPEEEVPDDVALALTRSMSLFVSLVGAISAELFGHLHNVAVDADRLFDVTIATTSAGIGLHVDLG
ncbi:TetR/AcrR family transcriptional regulator [Cellulomonas sp. NS3]|uniref:TetR/AcrR family transcriptional regulator n=1 Tax=Cellulomonas sp. NS3 TaxID=2973977 RepID=UPI0021621542|nr:TetR/AcrR family transcriptional regulator [Cellulomonas sp. NS3]